MVPLFLSCLFSLFGGICIQAADGPLFESQLIFPPDYRHNHASCIVECPNGDLLACWYHGSGERTADDVVIEGARKRKGDTKWSKPFLLADEPGFPDTNPCLFVDPQKRLWLIWQTILANEWHTALNRYQLSSHYLEPGAPAWDKSGVILFKPGKEFVAAVEKANKTAMETVPAERRERWQAYVDRRLVNAKDKYFSRMGWMTRVHPFVLNEKSWILPLYSDGYSFSIMALTNDAGATWTASEPLVGGGNIQPSIAKKKDGTLVTYMRDNGPPPKRLMMSESKDQGKTWSPVVDSALPNPGSGAEVVGLRDGNWALIYNDTERGRHSLAVSLSEDEGKSWKYTRHLEKSAADDPNATNGHYPSLFQAADGTLHATYTYSLRGKNVKKDEQGHTLRECIKYAHFDENWIKQGDAEK
jgi:predicted neuraminidase